jgi:hypothetical protein
MSLPELRPNETGPTASYEVPAVLATAFRTAAALTMVPVPGRPPDTGMTIDFPPFSPYAVEPTAVHAAIAEQATEVSSVAFATG